jgi:hypothetical protein
LEEKNRSGPSLGGKVQSAKRLGSKKLDDRKYAVQVTFTGIKRK